MMHYLDNSAMVYIPTNIFLCCRVGLPAASGGIVVAGVGAYLHHIQQSASGLLVVMRRVGTEEASRHYPASNTRLKADTVWLGSVEWWLEVGCWPPKPVKWNISRHIGGQEDKRVGSVAACPFVLLPTSVPTDVPLHWFCWPTADLKPPLYRP